MTDDIKTPRTDACSLGTVDEAYNRKGLRNTEVCDIDHAKELERDLALVTQERAALRKKLAEAYEKSILVARNAILEVDDGSPLENIAEDVEISIRALKTEGT